MCPHSRDFCKMWWKAPRSTIPQGRWEECTWIPHLIGAWHLPAKQNSLGGQQMGAGKKALQTHCGFNDTDNDMGSPSRDVIGSLRNSHFPGLWMGNSARLSAASKGSVPKVAEREALGWISWGMEEWHVLWGSFSATGRRRNLLKVLNGGIWLLCSSSQLCSAHLAQGWQHQGKSSLHPVIIGGSIGECELHPAFPKCLELQTGQL